MKISRQTNQSLTLYEIAGLAASIVILSLLSLTNVVFAQGGLDSQITTTTSADTSITNNNFNFAAAGDWGCTDHTEDTVNNILDKDPELVLGLGDYSYGNDPVDCWLDIIQPIDSITKISVGNHEEDQELEQLMTHFGLTEQYYSFDYQNVHFIALGTEEEYLDMSMDKAKEQLAFVQNDLEKASNNPNVDWIIPFFHRIMYAESEGGIVDPFDHNLEDIYHPLFEKYGVNLILQGHAHTYERTYPLRFNSEDSDGPIVTSEDLSNYRSRDGLVIATVGTGGIFPTSTYLDDELAPVQYNDLYGFLNVDVSSDGTTLIGTFYDNDGGEIRDRFTITKSGAEGDTSLSSSPPDLPVEEETDVVEELDDDGVDDVGLEDGLVPAENEDVDADANDDEQ